MFLVTLSLIVLLILVLALFPIGLPGRRVDDHPICRRCRFDLVGAPPGSAACPECGADVTHPGAVRTGNRVRRRGLRAGVLVVLLVALASVLMTGWVSVRGTDLTPYKPAWAVMREVDGPEAISRPALRELARRLGEGELSDEQMIQFADRALAHQADRSKPWLPAWGLFLEAAHDAGRLDAERWERYLRESVQFDLKVRPRVRRGDPVPVEVNWARVRVGNQKSFMVSFGGPAPLTASDVPLGMDVSPRTEAVLETLPPTRKVLVRPRATPLSKLRDGEHRLHAEVPVTITYSDRMPVEFFIRTEARFRLLPADVSSVTPVSDSDLARKLRASMHFDRLFVIGGPSTTFHPKRVKEVPVTLGFDVFLRAGKREWPMGPIVIHRGPANLELQNAYLCFASAYVPGLDATAVDVVLRSAPKASVESIYMTDTWEGEVVFKDVSVEYLQIGAPGMSAGTTQPSYPARGSVSPM